MLFGRARLKFIELGLEVHMTDKQLETTSSEYLGIASYIHTYIKQIISNWVFSELKSSPRSQAYIDRSGLDRSKLNQASTDQASTEPARSYQASIEIIL